LGEASGVHVFVKSGLPLEDSAGVFLGVEDADRFVEFPHDNLLHAEASIKKTWAGACAPAQDRFAEATAGVYRNKIRGGATRCQARLAVVSADDFNETPDDYRTITVRLPPWVLRLRWIRGNAFR